MRNSLYTIWLTYITSAIRDIDKKVLNVLKTKKDYDVDTKYEDALIYIEENNSKNVSLADVRVLPVDHGQNIE
jgi:hypothetical protein